MIDDGARYEGPCFRHSAVRHATIDEGTLLASKRAGGRFNPAGEFGAVYVALEPATALAELERRVLVSGLPRAHFRPRMLLKMRARLSGVADLTDPSVRRRFGLSAAEVAGTDWTPCQRVAREARDAGYTAIRFRSATGVGDNLAIFLDRLEPEETLDIETLEELTIDP